MTDINDLNVGDLICWHDVGKRLLAIVLKVNNDVCTIYWIGTGDTPSVTNLATARFVREMKAYLDEEIKYFA